MFENIIYIVIGSGLGLTSAIFLFKNKKFIDLEKDALTAQELIKSAKEESVRIKEEITSHVQTRKESIEQYEQKRNEKLSKNQEALKHKEEFINKREERNHELKLRIATLEEEREAMQSALQRNEKQLVEKLAAKSGQDASSVKELILNNYQQELENDNVHKLVKQEEWLKEGAERMAKNIIINTIQRLCSTSSVETRAVNVIVPRDQVKGKIIGKEGQNIKEFERLLEVDVVFNDMPNTISVSAFQLVKRRIAKRALEKLCAYKFDITPPVVQKIVEEAEKETDEELYIIGRNALERMGIKHDDKEFCRVTGRLQYRTSYGQNIMKHSMEVGWVAAMLGSEIGLNIETCKVGGFLHDLGKAIDQDPNVKDAHDFLSKELMEKFGFSWEEVHAAWTHHDAIPQETAEALIVKAADAVSASRPGARQESFDKYIQRMAELEETALSFAGVKSAFAISAGRELRVMVDPDSVKEEQAYELAKNMAAKIEEEMVYPGQIKVNVIRRTKYTEVSM
ncbi:MAG: Rnase Y domain-containing protein [Patescibacteria group bacterium]